VKHDVAVYIECERCGRKYVSVEPIAAPHDPALTRRRLLARRLGARPERHFAGRRCPKCGLAQSWMLTNRLRLSRGRWGWALAAMAAGAVGFVGGTGAVSTGKWAILGVLMAAVAALARLLAVPVVWLCYRSQLALSKHHTAKTPKWDLVPERDWTPGGGT
jgi:hypothetical protein